MAGAAAHERGQARPHIAWEEGGGWQHGADLDVAGVEDQRGGPTCLQPLIQPLNLFPHQVHEGCPFSADAATASQHRQSTAPIQAPTLKNALQRVQP